MAPVANRPSHCNSAWPSITWPRGIDTSASKPNLSDFNLAMKAASAASGRVPILPITAPLAVTICA